MTDDIEVLRAWIRFVVVYTAIGATSFPIIYSFSPWRSRPLGRVIMLLGISLAAAIDLTLLFSFWSTRSIYVTFWVNIFVLNAIFISTSLLSWMVWRINYTRKRVYTMLLSGKLYDVLKTWVLIVLPGVGTLYFTIAQIWDLMYAEEVSGTLGALALFLGGILKVSSSTYKAQPATYDGGFVLEPHPDGEGMKQLRLVQPDLKALETKDVITFKLIPSRVE